MFSSTILLPCRSVYFAGLLLILGSLGVFAQTVYEGLVVRSPFPTINNITNLKHENGKFLATTDRNGILLSSDDGTSWVTHKTPYPNSLQDVTFGNGIYVVTSSGSGPAYFSSDLTNWTEIGSNLLPSNNDNVYFYDGLFYFGGQMANNKTGLHTTSNGVDFTQIDTPAQSQIEDIIFANNQFVTIGNDLEVMTSPNGTDWTVQTVSVAIPDGDLGEGLINIQYLNSLYIVGGKANTILTSPDGVTWTLRDFSEDSSWFFDSWFNAGTYYFPGRQGTIWTTTDFTTWTGIDLDANDDVYNIVNAEGITVVTGRTGNLFTSTDLTNWTDQKTGFSQSFSSVAYGADLFLAADFDGNVIKSSDGITWDNSFTPGINVSWAHLAFEDNKFVAMSSSGEWILSATGLPGQWSLPSDGFDGFANISALRYLNDKWYVVGRNGFLRSSTNLTNWDIHDITTDNDLTDIAYGDGIFVVVGRGPELHTSPDGSTWTSRDSTTTNDLISVAYGNGKFVILGVSATGLTSVDGITWTSDGQVSPPFFPRTMTFRDGQFEELSSLGRVTLSADGLSWSTVNTAVGVNMAGIAVSDTTMVAVGQSGTILSGPTIPPKTLTVNIVGEGTVTTSPEGTSFPNLSKVTLTAEGTPDFAFSNWSGDASGNTNPLIVTMDADKTITAHFVLALTGYELFRYLNFTTEERADDNLSGPDADFDNDGLTNNDEFLLDTDPKVFDEPKSLVVNILGEGTVDISPPGGGPYTFMSEVTLTATGTPEFAFSGWLGDASGTTNPLVVTMDADKSISANFSLDLEGFLLFRYTEFTAEERLDDDLAGPQADYDKDGLSNLEEYLLGTDPKSPDFGKGLQVGTVDVSGQLYLTVTYNRSTDISGVTQTVEVGSDFSSWLSGPSYSEVYSVDDNGDGTEAVTMRILDPIGSLPSWFVRLVFEE